MKRVILLSGCIALLLGMTACNMIEKEERETDRKVILNLPPFDSIGDSIRNDPENAGLLLERAVRLSQHTHHDLASEDYKKAWELTKDEQILMAYISNVLLVGDFSLAVDLLKEGQNQFDHNPEFSRRLGEVYMKLDRPQLALKEYDHILQRDSSDFEVWFERGMLLSKMNDTANAIRSLERSYESMPIAYTGLALANLYVSVKDSRALDICDAILNRDSSIHQIDALFLKGVYYAETGNPTEAVKQFDDCIRRDWKFIDAHLEKGIVYYKQRDYEQALEVFKLATTVSNTVADPWYWVGRVYEAQGNSDEARLNYQRALSLEPDFYEAEIRLRNLARTEG